MDKADQMRQEKNIITTSLFCYWFFTNIIKNHDLNIFTLNERRSARASMSRLFYACNFFIIKLNVIGSLLEMTLLVCVLRFWSKEDKNPWQLELLISRAHLSRKKQVFHSFFSERLHHFISCRFFSSSTMNKMIIIAY